MSDSESISQPRRNHLHALAAVGGLVMGVFLLLGAYGHYAAVWPMLDAPLDEGRFRLLLPGLMLALPGVINIVVCRAVWVGARWSVNLSLAANILAAVYLGYQLFRGVPGHPIGLFLALVSSYTLLLVAIRLGLVWPTREFESAGPSGKANT